MRFPTLHNLTLVKGLKIPAELRDYLGEVSRLTGVALCDDRAP